MQLKKKVQTPIRKREWQKLGVNLAVVYQEAKAEGKRIDYSFTAPINMLPRTINDNSRTKLPKSRSINYSYQLQMKN